MAKLWNRLLSAQTAPPLLKNGPKSDDKDDDDSSLSEKQSKPHRTKTKLRFRKKMSGGDDDGYESDASGRSDESTRSTSSSFLKFQTRPKWKSFFGKTAVQRAEDGSEMPVEIRSKWQFGQIYKRQNRRRKDDASSEEDGENSDFEEEEEDGERVLAPPAPLSGRLSFNRNVVEKESRVSLATDCSPREKRDCSPVTTQESGISTCERSERSVALSVVASKTSLCDSSTALEVVPSITASSSSHSYPTQDPAYLEIEVKADIPTIRNSKNDSTQSRNKKRPKPTTKNTNDILTPLSIPLTICYSLRSAIGDGSARQRNSHALMERRSLRPNGSHLDCSHWSHRGKRSYMEDRFVIEHIGRGTRSKDSPPITWLAVFDGHGGAAASQFCSDWMSSYVRKNEFFPEQLPRAMETAFTKLDSDFVSSGNLDGSTACACAVIGHEKVICCNAGDSRAIIVKRDGSHVVMSQDHKPGRNDETKRINDLGGRVIYWGRWRVEGVLAVSRSIGDAKLKPYVTAHPDIVEHEIGEDDMFLVVASDGVWDTMTSDLVAKFVLVNTCKIVDKSLHVDDTLFRWIARQISKRARENGSSDNVSCIVAHLKSK